MKIALVFFKVEKSKINLDSDESYPIKQKYLLKLI